MAQAVRAELTLDDIHVELFDMLSRFDAFCRSHGLEYSIIAGTLLGAVRHQGFIPWDDDVDVAMLREDYDKLAELADEFYAQTGLRLCGYAGVDLAITPVCRISNERIVTEYDDTDGQGLLSIDLSPVDQLPHSAEATTDIYRHVERWRKILMALNAKPSTGKTPLTRFVKRLAHPLRKSRGLMRFIAGRIYGYATSTPVDGSEFVGSVSWGIGGGNERMYKWWFTQKVELPFEGRHFMAMERYGDYLTHIYGGYYMQFPPESSRKPSHGTRAWHVGEEAR